MSETKLQHGVTRGVGAIVGPMLTRRTMLAGSLTAAAVGVSACGFGANDPEQGPGNEPGAGEMTDTLREARRPPNHLNPAFGGSGSPQGTILMSMMWEGLVRRDPADSANYLPGVAESWEASEDGLTYTFKLRETTWNNGDPLTANDFVWSYAYYYSPKLGEQENENPPAKNGSESRTKIKGLPAYYTGETDDFSTVGIEATDEQTLVFTMTEPDPEFINSLVSLLPLHQESVEANVQDFWMPEKLVCNGPYPLVEYAQNSGGKMELSDTYWDKDSYSIKTREIQFNSSGATGMMVSYNANEIDTFRVDGDPSALIAGRSDLEEQLVRGTLIQFKGLQLLASKNEVLRTKLKVRQALALAIDREALASVAPPDVAGPSWVPSDITGADQLPAIPFDPDRAKALLEEAGHAGGKDIPMLSILTYATMPMLEATAEMWGEHLGIKAEVAVREVGVYGDELNGNKAPEFTGFAFNYQAPSPFSILRYGAQPTPYWNRTSIPYDVEKEIFDITRGDRKGEFTPVEQLAKVEELTEANWTPEYKKFAEQNAAAVAALSDPERATELATQACITMQETYYWIPLLWAGYTFMIKPRIKGMIPTSYPDHIYGLKGVTLDPL
ncbi:peptide ABC transporter substrate-binding protein [Microlunatus sp. Y2014]|uniref:peptide ABC transporter substrate-binding protein n=1 Tax=Microlunatus sp. Y2014 TaxID=3418488 RepID=UPI003DA74C22